MLLVRLRLVAAGAPRRVSRLLSTSAAASSPSTAGGSYSSTKYFDKILIANRGEIACRVIRSAKKLGIKTVAVYSQADAGALHVRLADEAVCVGPAASAQSYLNVDNIIQAMKSTGAQAVHPGYGFLSENAAFVERLEQEKLVFIGPTASAIHAMGDKIESKKLARKAGVNVIPGVDAVVKDENEAVKIAKEIGYPVMIKASAGGGGKGMRIAWNDEEAREGFRLSSAEAKSSFKDDRLLIEKFIVDPRHIEIQVMADKFGNALWLNERECSIQRRNQKVLEEAPSVVLDPETRRAMGEQAVALAKAVGYCSAGTVEMIVDKNKNFYFLEMNTRLQVEHPVTEYITGLDLVELMFLVASGQKLPLKQEDVEINGWAMEARVYAEDPYHDFLPSIGRLTRYVEPDTDNGNVRVDAGVVEGSEISIYYDPLISKLVAHGRDRNEAIEKLKTALDSYVIRGVTNNASFLQAILNHPRYVAGNMTTAFIAEEFPTGFHGYQLGHRQRQQLLAVTAALRAQRQQTAATVEGRLASSCSVVDASETNVVLRLGDKDYAVRVEPSDVSEGYFSSELPSTSFFVEFEDELHDNKEHEVRDEHEDDEEDFGIHVELSPMHTNGLLHATVDGVPLVLQVVEIGFNSLTVQICGTAFHIQAFNAREHHLFSILPAKVAPDTSKLLLSPMPGEVTSILVEVGQSVAPGQGMAIVEAMKMQNVLRASRAGKVAAIPVKPGQIVSVDQLLVELE